MKKLLRRWLLGQKTWGRNAVRDSHADAAALLKGVARQIVDGGANKGKTVAKFLERFGQAEIHAFEPIPELQQRLRESFADRQNVHVHPVALGRRAGTVPLHITAHDPASSLMSPSKWNWAYWQHRMDVVRTIRTPLVRLDSEVTGEVDVLKLDLQGSELAALEGATGLLPQTKIILTEVEFVELYDGQPLFSELDAFLREQGFRLYNLYSLFTQRDGQLIFGDALYLNTRYFPDEQRQQQARDAAKE